MASVVLITAWGFEGEEALAGVVDAEENPALLVSVSVLVGAWDGVGAPSTQVWVWGGVCWVLLMFLAVRRNCVVGGGGAGGRWRLAV